MTTLTMPTPEELEAEALELEGRAAKKERQAEDKRFSNLSTVFLRRDAGYFREEAASKRAKAERMRKK